MGDIRLSHSRTVFLATLKILLTAFFGSRFEHINDDADACSYSGHECIISSKIGSLLIVQ
jgi:hypothetical protein